MHLELLADKAQFNFFLPLTCSCGARTCTTSCSCIIFGLYCILAQKYTYSLDNMCFFEGEINSKWSMLMEVSRMYKCHHSVTLPNPIWQPQFSEFCNCNLFTYFFVSQTTESSLFVIAYVKVLKLGSWVLICLKSLKS